MTKQELISEVHKRLAKVERRVKLRKDFWKDKYEWVFEHEIPHDEYQIKFYSSLLSELEK